MRDVLRIRSAWPSSELEAFIVIKRKSKRLPFLTEINENTDAGSNEFANLVCLKIADFDPWTISKKQFTSHMGAITEEKPAQHTKPAQTQARHGENLKTFRQ